MSLPWETTAADDELREDRCRPLMLSWRSVTQAYCFSTEAWLFGGFLAREDLANFLHWSFAGFSRLLFPAFPRTKRYFIVSWYNKLAKIWSNLLLLTWKTILGQHVSSLTNFSLLYTRMTPTASHQLLLLVNYNRSMTNYGFENMRRNICYRHTFCINCKEFLYFYIMCCTVGRASEKCKNLF